MAAWSSDDSEARRRLLGIESWWYAVLETASKTEYGSVVEVVVANCLFDVSLGAVAINKTWWMSSQCPEIWSKPEALVESGLEAEC